MLLTPIKAIRAKCIDCCCGNLAEVRRCEAVNCPIHPYRMGHRPAKPTDIIAGDKPGKTADSSAVLVAK